MYTIREISPSMLPSCDAVPAYYVVSNIMMYLNGKVDYFGARSFQKYASYPEILE